jgi:hypothetical protein
MSMSFSSDVSRSIQHTSQLASDDPATSADGGPFTETRSMSTRLSLQTEPSVPNIGSSGNMTTHRRRTSHVNSDVLKIPSAIVVSGLEHASLPAQRAVLRTLVERKLTVSDNHSEIEPGLQLDLPDDFIMVYVCRLDPYERPPIYNSLVCTFYTVWCVILCVPARLVCYEYAYQYSAIHTSRNA